MLLRFIYLSGFIQLEDSGQQPLVTDQSRCARPVTNGRHPSSFAQGDEPGLPHQPLTSKGTNPQHM